MANFLRSRRGQMTLPFVLLIGGIIVEVAIAGAFVTYFLSSSGYGERLSVRATAAAESGIRDAMMRITQNKEFVPDAGQTSYSIYVSQDNNDFALVSVGRTTQSGVYRYTVTSLGTAVSRQRKFSAVVSVSAVTGRVELESIKEIPVE